MRVSKRLSAMLMVGFLFAALAVGGTGGGGLVAPEEAQARQCTMGMKAAQRMGVSYVLQFTARGISCKRAKRVVRAFHQCRRSKPKGGKRGRCMQSRVRGFRCTEGKRTSQPIGYYARVVCKRGKRRVNHLYQVQL